jgi:predicted  nucleic acid-binding Zn-ribbon protein
MHRSENEGQVTSKAAYLEDIFINKFKLSERGVKDKISKVLFALSETDLLIREQTDKCAEIERERATLYADLARSREKLEALEGSYKEAVSRHNLEDHRLKDEEAKIVERRKQLTALGGAKSAKLVERELDIATRVMETLEKSASEAAEEAERLTAELDDLKTKVEALEGDFDEQTKEAESALQEANTELQGLEKTRNGLLAKLDDRLKNLYRRVSKRYSGDAVAKAVEGACRSCYRALPAQTWNQVMAGNMLIQCPGCNRVMVFVERP